MGDIEELIGLVLTGQHPKLRDSASAASSIGIVSVFERIALVRYNAAGVCAVLADRCVEVDAKAPNSFAQRPAPLKIPPPWAARASIIKISSRFRAKFACEFLKGDSYKAKLLTVLHSMCVHI